MARASLRGGAIRKEMRPHCVQSPRAWPPQRAVPIESGRFALAHQTPSAARRAANPDSTCPDSIGIGIPPVNRGDPDGIGTQSRKWNRELAFRAFMS